MKIHWLSWYLHSTILLLSSLSVLFTLIRAKGRSIPPTYKYPTLLFRILKCEHNHISSITISKLFNHILWSWVHFKWMGICWQCIMNLDGSMMKKKSYHFICKWSHQNIKYICDQARRRHVVFCDKTELIIIVQYNCMCCHEPPSYNMRQRFSRECKLLYTVFFDR